MKKKGTSYKNFWKKEWQNMPEFVQKDLSPFKTVKVHFRNQKDMNTFSKLLNQKITKYNVLWYPEAKKRTYADKRWVDES